jgi:hypothetical protein
MDEIARDGPTGGTGADAHPGGTPGEAPAADGEVTAPVPATDLDRFFDAETGGPVQLQVEQDGTGFRLLRPFGYHDPRHPGIPFVVPADAETFRTDLASIPRCFAWLVPGLGTHLPAILLHDGLVTGADGRQTHIGPAVDREEADLILREAMASLGTPRLRRWLMWTAVALATCWSTLTPRRWWQALVVATVGTVVVLGVVATADLADLWDVLPWMGRRVWWAEVVGGALFAVLVPLVLSLAWWRRWRVAAIGGVVLAFLLHVTALVAVLSGLYWVAETLVSRPEGSAASVRANMRRASGAIGPSGPAADVVAATGPPRATSTGAPAV